MQRAMEYKLQSALPFRPTVAWPLVQHNESGANQRTCMSTAWRGGDDGTCSIARRESDSDCFKLGTSDVWRATAEAMPTRFMSNDAAAGWANAPEGAVAHMLQNSNISAEYASAASRCASLVTMSRAA
jgi:hypothetical protein